MARTKCEGAGVGPLLGALGVGVVGKDAADQDGLILDEFPGDVFMEGDGHSTCVW